MKRKSRSDIRKIQDLIWQECRRIVYERDNRDGEIDCYTCGARDIQGCNRQLGHMWAKASLSCVLKYHLDILKYQCYKCNINYGGQGAVFYAKRTREIGEQEMRKLEQMKNDPPMVNAMDHYKILLELYKTS